MSDLQDPSQDPDVVAPGSDSRLSRAVVLVGSAGLLLAMGSDATAVLGRHLGIPFLGSIELVQSCVVVAATCAMVGATLWRSHATVHILIERMSPRGRAWLEAFSALLGAVCFLILAAGSVWLIADLWGGDERTELLGIPLFPLRLFWVLGAAMVSVLFLARAVSCVRRGVRS